MKSLFCICAFLCALSGPLCAQTNTGTAPAKIADTAKADATNQTAKATAPWPVTAIVVSNTIIFPSLLSKSGSELMTNALFRRSFGRKVIFADGFNLRSFDVDQLHPSVLAQLSLDPDKLKADQAELDQKNKDWAIQNQQKNQQILAAQAAALSKGQAAQQAGSTNGEPNAPPAGGSSPRHHKQNPGQPGGQPPPSN